MSFFKVLGTIADPFALLASSKRLEYESAILEFLNFLYPGYSSEKNLVKGAVAKTHCSILFMKQVLPMFDKPTGR